MGSYVRDGWVARRGTESRPRHDWPSIVEVCPPDEDLEVSALDRLLDAGWERVGPLMYRSLFGQLDGETVSIVPLRVDVQPLPLTRNQRKLLARNRRQFRIEVGPVLESESRELLYERSRSRFVGIQFDSLAEFLGVEQPPAASTRELRVFDGTRLIALSYFIEGEASSYSLIGLYDREYARHSLGMYTMLEEIAMLHDRGGKWFYPGNFVPNFPSTRYKLRLQPLSFLHWDRGWTPIAEFDQSELPAEVLDAKLGELGRELERAGLRARVVANPYFTIPYVMPLFSRCLAQPCHLVIEGASGESVDPPAAEARWVAEYDVMTGRFHLAAVQLCESKSMLSFLSDSEEFESHGELPWTRISARKNLGQRADVAATAIAAHVRLRAPRRPRPVPRQAEI